MNTMVNSSTGWFLLYEQCKHNSVNQSHWGYISFRERNICRGNDWMPWVRWGSCFMELPLISDTLLRSSSGPVVQHDCVWPSSAYGLTHACKNLWFGCILVTADQHDDWAKEGLGYKIGYTHYDWTIRQQFASPVIWWHRLLHICIHVYMYTVLRKVDSFYADYTFVQPCNQPLSNYAGVYFFEFQPPSFL